MAKRGTRRRKEPKPIHELPVVHRRAAGIDIGAEEHFVAVPEDCGEESIRPFGCFTEDLHRLAGWLKEHAVTTVAMESTGVYWIPLYQILEAQGFEVVLVNARHVKNVPGRKSDVKDCRWLQTLHTYGLLSGSFRPSDEICVLRSYLRHRATLVEESSAHVQRMQKALTQMNVQLHRVISDITGVTGLRIIDAILAGERDRSKLAALRDGRIRKSAEEIAKALEGDYREEHLFVLQHERDLYAELQAKISECEARILVTLDDFESQRDQDAEPSGTRREQLATQLHRIAGVDITAVPGLQVITVLDIVSEVGLDMSCWPTVKHFGSWLTLAPNHDISGGKVIRTRSRAGAQRAANAFRMAAQAAGRTQTAIGAFYRRKAAALGKKKAIKATAHKLARIVYFMLSTQREYVETGHQAYEEAYRGRVLRNLKRRAHQLGYDLVEAGEAV